MYKKLTFLIILLLMTANTNAQQQSSDITIGEVDLSALKWGTQTATVTLTNNTDIIKYIICDIDFTFTESYVNANRKVRSNHFIYPGQTKTIKPDFYVPGNFGKAEITLNLFDVLDTLDAVMDYQKFYTQPFFINFRVPEEVYNYTQEKLTLPPRVDMHPYYANEFSRTFFVMLAEGKKVADIAKMLDCEESFIHEAALFSLRQRFIKKVGEEYELNFPVIRLKEAEETRKVVETTSDALYEQIKENLPTYQTTLDSIIAAKGIPNDSVDFMSSASLLFQPYPVTSGLLLWYDLGRKFITRSAPLYIYNGTDICNADIYQYMYLVEGGDLFNGTHFYYQRLKSTNDLDIIFSEKKPPLKCDDDFLKPTFNPQKTVLFKDVYPDFPEFYIIDTAKVRPFLDHLDKGCDAILAEAYNSLKDIALKNGHDKVSFGHRYWFWNQVATETLHKLKDNNVIKERGNSYFRYDNIARN